MTLNFNAKIELTAKEKTKAIFDSIAIDNKFYPQDQTDTKISFNKKIFIEIDSNQVPHLRANLNSTLRLIQASIDSITSVNT